ncbi:Ppx/GppA phosphatase family protein [Seleniivibrio sp.]|uniref:Ppx/GppA phosphatase family protein n=1 Tax=Seleniivibrio sp. TaxID=2898801 RepID=UPI0025D881CF|nr:Ppx/GppA phosphatase family protein [Seleniivibrio sp.]MCD8552619.1 Ppx/GppA family phosphatase [Seleniivibrio sp.]
MASNDNVRVAVADIGSNSLRLQISEVKDKSYRVLEDYKEMIRLGDTIYTLGYFPKETIEILVDTLNNVRRLAESKGCRTIRAIATAAFREADNLGETLNIIEQECGIKIEVISGQEEARLTYLAASANFELKDRYALITDIGGGSAEYTVVRNGDVEKAKSLPLGCNRLTREFLEGDPPTSAQILAMKEHIAEFIDKMKLGRGLEMVICTGGSMNNVGYICHYKDKNLRDSLVKYVERKFLKKFISDIRMKSNEERIKIEGMEEKRADIILSAAIQTDMILEETGIDGFYTLTGGLRAGLTIDTINKMGIELPFQNSMDGVRYSRLVEIGNKFDFDEAGAFQVEKLAKMLFDGLKDRMGLIERDWALLEAAALLRDIGKHIAYSKHHKHSYYMIKHSELVGYTHEEIEAIASIARYHRKSMPKVAHDEFISLSPAMQLRVEKLAALLRLAIALDRTHKGLIDRLEITVTNVSIDIKPISDKDITLEIKDFERNRDMLVKLLKLPVRLV